VKAGWAELSTHHEDRHRNGDGEKMLAKNTRASVTTVTLALVIGITMALWLALAPAPAKAQSGDVLRLLSIKAVDITSDEGVCLPIVGCAGDDIDEPYIKVDGVEVWSGRSDPLRMKKGDVRNLTGVSARLSGESARVQLWESDPGTINRPDDGPAEFFADYTGGDQRTVTLPINGGVYELTYVVDRNTPPQFGLVKPTGRIHDRTPLIRAVVRDAETDLTKGNITTFTVDGRAKTFGYDTVSDSLVHKSGKLAPGRHTVTVTANDGQAQNTRVWSFRIVR
jgi:hypothetical protein